MILFLWLYYQERDLTRQHWLQVWRDGALALVLLLIVHVVRPLYC